ncbi:MULTISPECIES: histidine phosphatase family protein [Brachybacterium]|uniref:Histidine phosphatase family protein n=2 Tax=Brachybacterium TaxID=43668 RepID=A0A426SPF4_9MICO|nr:MULTISPECIES: histidine phosphatase family protein [Brachybacterium]MCZ4324955.1 histidine phosphatase family protein [Brachybacterium paraconglomeratum]RRR20004.1 histidine phosphatase family protein [Brachybacterium paraconglomeratum]GLI31853.1 phosphoglycerate mutase [Brachybacterium conglomeratum]GLK03386.1 phosphoglycerate mutase [Brachybacterium conglomeratum]
MPTRTLHIVRHGRADALGALTEEGRSQCRALGRRLADVPLDVIWHSPLPRAVDSAAVLAEGRRGLLVDEAPELVDAVPFVPDLDSLSPRRAAFFDGIDEEEAAAGHELAGQLADRFLRPHPPGARSTEELLVTHAFQVSWLVREALGAPPVSWMSLGRIENTALTTIVLEQDELPMLLCVNDRSHLEDDTA